MNHSPTLLLSLSLLFCLNSACSQVNDNNEVEEGRPTYVKLSPQRSSTPAQSATVAMLALRDPQTGMVNQYMPLPADWRITDQGIEGPAGTVVQEMPGSSFMDHQRYIQSIDDLIQQDVHQLIQQNGAQYLRTIDLPAVAQRDERLGLQYWQAMPMEKDFITKGIEVRDKEGKPGLLVLHYTQSRSQYGRHHSYYLHVLSSSEAHYASDKEVLCFALANLQSNPEAVQAFNLKMQQEYMQRERMHAAKMKQAQDNFNAWNRTHVETWKDINESSMASWRRRNDVQDAGHARSVDAISGRERLANPYGGQALEVDAGYQYYYTNAFGEVIGSNDAFFNPAQDPSLNHQEWRRATFGQE